MKTTVEIADAILAEAKRIAATERTTLRELVETGLRQVISQRRSREAFVLRDASVSGGGLRDEYAGGEWAPIRDAIYEGRGA